MASLVIVQFFVLLLSSGTVQVELALCCACWMQLRLLHPWRRNGLRDAKSGVCPCAGAQSCLMSGRQLCSAAEQLHCAGWSLLRAALMRRRVSARAAEQLA